MPPNTPRNDLPTIAVVIARLIVKGEDRGVRPFLVPMSDGTKMCTGITSKYRSATNLYRYIQD
jgi:acyl-CoA oxidase